MAQKDLEQQVVGFITDLRKVLPASKDERKWLACAARELKSMNLLQNESLRHVRQVQDVIQTCAVKAKRRRTAERFDSLYHQLSAIQLASMRIQNSLQPKEID